MSDETGRVIDEVLARAKRIAVLGMKTEAQVDAPAFYVPKYMADHGFDIVPVPVYYPDATEILGRPVYRTVAAIDPPVDMVCVFRRAKDLDAHFDDLMAAKPKVVWLQLGIRNEAFGERLRKAGITVVQDRCLMVEHRLRNR